ncbi:uncharacterized protein LOC120942953 isoform X1 [Rana temporaria]|uniref:uncharacterized protein LOC120942953 isoform X1 n=1 Tax=Rana temporaria TaxID=8407 RepID=UPI001AAD03F4|nr:uncharacterized protein LOC120942953 isoform X1 [Rana temporaria]
MLERHHFQHATSGKRKAAMKHSVGIFSRSDKGDYAWLVTLFSSSDFSDCIQDVRSTVISNSGFQQFIDDASHCSLGIIYHTKNRGRVNITDISGSLYDEELDSLNQLLGRDNVIVVIDDVEDSSHEEKIRILKLQPTIEKLARDLLLISKTEKNNTKTLMTKLRNLTASTSEVHGRSNHGGPDPHVGRSNLEEKLTDTNQTKCKTKDSKPLRGDKSPNTKSTLEILISCSSKSPGVSFRNEGPQTWNDCDGYEFMRGFQAPVGISEESQMPCQSQKMPPSIENLETLDSSETENLYETPDTCINDKPKPRLKNQKSTVWYISENLEKLPNDEFQKDEFSSKTSKIGFNSESLEKLPSKGYPTTQLNNETSNIPYRIERSNKPPIDEFSKVHLYNKPSEVGYTYKSSETKLNHERSKELCDNSDSQCKDESFVVTPPREKCPKQLSSQKSPESQSNNGKWSCVVDELKKKQ